MLEQWANHNHIALYAARPHKPKDKAAVENFVKITYRRVYAQLRIGSFPTPRGYRAIVADLRGVDSLPIQSGFWLSSRWQVSKNLFNSGKTGFKSS